MTYPIAMWGSPQQWFANKGVEANISGIPEGVCSLMYFPNFDACFYTNFLSPDPLSLSLSESLLQSLEYGAKSSLFLLITFPLLKRSVSENSSLDCCRVFLLYQEIFMPEEITLS